MTDSRLMIVVHSALPTSGCVKQAAGTLRWLSTWSRPHMCSTAEMPCSDCRQGSGLGDDMLGCVS